MPNSLGDDVFGKNILCEHLTVDELEVKKVTTDVTVDGNTPAE